jgi:uncharacterized repeat protein (TIGR03803 family)
MNTNGTGYSIIYNLGPINVGDPQSELVLSGNALFGTTRYGGTNNLGTIYAVNTDGTGFTILHSFTGGNDGDTPQSRLVLSGSTLYGTTSGGGVNRGGTVFSITTNGTAFTPLYSFTGGNDGGNPNNGGLILSGGILYGITVWGGTNNNGTVFKINTGNSSFTSLYSFSATAYYPQEDSYTNRDGANPSSGLVLSGGTLYGTANGGGANGVGTVFAINTGGTGFTNLHSFSQIVNSTNSDGAGPAAGLVLAGGTLYGAANGGGAYGRGTLFSLNTNGTGFTILHTFTDGPLGDGGNPSEDMILVGTTLIGDDGAGDVYAINTNGSDYLILYSLNGTTDGAQAGGPDGGPQSGGLVLASGTLYGTAETQGAGGYGTVFALSLPVILTNIVVSPVNSVIGVSSNEQFTATGYFQFTPTQTLTSNLTWVSSSSPVASINNNGLVTGLMSGITTITAISGSISNSAMLTVVAPPAIFLQPTNITVSPNGSVTLNVSASGGDLTYQWQLNGNNIAGATGATYQIPNVTSTNIGVYTVIVSNLAGSTTSQAAIVGNIAIQLFAGVIVNGPVGSNYVIQATSDLLSGWTTLTNIALPTQPYIYIDYSSPTNRQQFYRAVPQ